VRYYAKIAGWWGLALACAITYDKLGYGPNNVCLTGMFLGAVGVVSFGLGLIVPFVMFLQEDEAKRRQ
jgi:hypothetical protein